MTRNQQILTAGGLAAGAVLLAHALRERRKLDLYDRVALITGGSRGLGLLIARELGSFCCRVVLAARDPGELERACLDLEEHGVETSTIAADVSIAADATRIVNEVVAQHGRIDILVNNAGIIKVGPEAHMDVADYKEAMDVHFWGPLHTMRAAIPHMRRSGGGRIVNISSIGGKIGVPHLVPYCASKFALTGLSSALRGELVKDGILVTTVCPGLMRTGSPFNAWFKGNHRAEFAWFVISDSLPMLTINGRRAAAQVVDAMRAGDAELVITWPAKIAIVANNVLPELVANAMALTNAVLPGPVDGAGNESRSGWQSGSEWAPSKLTALTERAAAENNELPPAPTTA
jgi:NAD(P)-dependent dehydrogenase (short-subunit alcohol dehydrogenase family)